MWYFSMMGQEMESVAEQARDLPQSWIRRHYSAFDGLRAVAVMMVFAEHYLFLVNGHLRIQGLWAGVDLFFVLSGFLITGILYDSRHSPRYFRDFYTRRSLRILPLSYGFFLLVLLLTPILHLEYSRYIWANVLYVANIIPSFAPGFHQYDASVLFVPHFPNREISLGPLWSLCVEEQFYLVWPLVVWLATARERLLRAC